MTDPVDRLAALIEAERDALLCGDFDRVATLFEEKQGLVEELHDLTLSEPVLSELRGELHRNQALFDRALEGLRAVAHRLTDLAHVRKSLTTYDSRGQSQTFAAMRSDGIERRA